MTSKCCTNCEQDQPLDDFYARAGRPGKTLSWCKACVSESRRLRDASSGGREKKRARDRARRLRLQAEREPRPTQECPACGAAFDPTNVHHRYCDPACRPSEQKFGRRATYLYVAFAPSLETNDGQQVFKVGVTSDPENRKRMFACHSPVPLKFLFLPLRDAGRVEMAFHERFNQFRLHGEWFRASNQEVEETMGSAA